MAVALYKQENVNLSDKYNDILIYIHIDICEG